MSPHKINKENVNNKVGIHVPSISYFTLFRFARKCDKLQIFVAMLASIVTGLMIPYGIALNANMFHNMIKYASSKDDKKDSEAFMQSIYDFATKYSCLGLIAFLGGYLSSTFMNITAINQIFRIREAYLRAALNQDFKYYDLWQSGDFASKMAKWVQLQFTKLYNDMIKLEEGIGDKLTSIAYMASAALGCILMALFKGWKLALLCLITTPISFVLIGITSWFAQRLSKKAAAESGNASAIAEDVLSSVRTVFAFNGQQREIERYILSLKRTVKINIKKEMFMGLTIGFIFFCIFCSYAMSFYLGVYLIIHDPDHYNPDIMFSVFMGVITGVANFGMIGTLVGSIGSARGAGAQVFYLLDNVPTINPLLNRGITPALVEGNVELKNVVFQYPSRPEVEVLKGVSLNVRRGQSVAVVGHSGCGKSSLVQLISRYYDVCGGCVLIDGYDIREVAVRWLRAQIALVGQQPVLFNTTVRENIRFGRQDASDAEIVNAARQANAHQFVKKLPKGYDTQVGESGASLSGGQKQRIAIARALVRHSPILLLDEATSALDNASEAKVQIELERLSETRATLIVAHRLSTIRNVDMIYVMKSGQVIEQGNHDELFKKKGHYYDMLILQEPVIAENEGVGPNREISAISESGDEDIPEPAVTEDDEKSEAPNLTFCEIMKLNAPEWKYIVLGCISSTVIGFGMPLFTVLFGDLFGSMADPDTNSMLAAVSRIAAMCVFVGVMLGIANFSESLMFGIAGSRLTERLRHLMFAHLLRQNVSYFDNPANSTGALCARLSAEAAYVQGATGQRIGVVLQAIGCVGLALTLAFFYEWRIGLLVIAFFPILGLVIYYQSKNTTQESFGNVKSLESSTKLAMEAISNVRTVASLGREPDVVAEYVAQLRPAVRPAKSSAHFRGAITGLSRSLFNFINAAAMTYGAHLIVKEGVPFQNLLVTTQSLQMASATAQNAFTYAPEFQKGVQAASRAVALLNTQPLLVDPATPAVSPFIATGNASFSNVEFRYPTRPGVKVLRGLDLQIPPGKTIALVGKSGSGKSTVISLLQRYYDPEAGLIALDGIPLPKLLIDEVRANYGLVCQEPSLFDRTIRENIAYGDNSRALSDDEIVEAAKKANIHSFIVSLPQGYDTNIGSKGTQLSGGQKQRVAIARALIRNPKLLLLDEATSALDTESEKVVQDALDRARAGRTCVTIAHRLSTVRDADFICVVELGQVVETGTHNELMAKKGVYFKLHTKGL